MEFLQTAQAGALPLFGTAMLLGIRHGIDWDHIAAITDIASTTAIEESAGHRTSFRRMEMRSLWLAFMYALGHATMVVLLGFAAISFTNLLPAWIDPIMERIVGVTLLVLGVWVFYSLGQYLRGVQDFQLRSRWMLVFAGIRHTFAWLRARRHGHSHDEAFRVDQYGTKTAYGVGVIHGIGAETGSQVLLIAALGGAASQDLGIGMMMAFVVGLLLSNTIVAVLAATGFISSAKAKPFYIGLGVVTGVFSIAVGAFFAIGASDALPDLQQALAFITGADN